MLDSELPIFALPCVIFPGERIPFHMFEQRYLAMVRDCLDSTQSTCIKEFGILCATKEARQTVGCSATISRILSRNDDGSIDVLTHATRRFRIQGFRKGFEYPVAAVDFFDDTESPNTGRAGIAATLHTKLVELTTGKIQVPLFEKYDQVSFLLGHNAGLDLLQRQQLLEMTTERERLDYLIAYYRRTIPKALADQELRDRVALNGHIRSIRSTTV